MIPDEQNDDLFEYGDRTMFQLRTQSFTIENDYGTMIIPGSSIPLPIVEIEPPADVEDPVARLERKLDTALRLIESLQHKIDSMDVTLARALNR
jgi:hypothetical protein